MVITCLTQAVKSETNNHPLLERHTDSENQSLGTGSPIEETASLRKSIYSSGVFPFQLSNKNNSIERMKIA